MSLLANVCKAFAQQMKDDAEFYKQGDLKKQKKGEPNIIDMKQEIKSNWNQFLENNRKEK